MFNRVQTNNLFLFLAFHGHSSELKKMFNFHRPTLVVQLYTGVWIGLQNKRFNHVQSALEGQHTVCKNHNCRESGGTNRMSLRQSIEDTTTEGIHGPEPVPRFSPCFYLACNKAVRKVRLAHEDCGLLGSSFCNTNPILRHCLLFFHPDTGSQFGLYPGLFPKIITISDYNCSRLKRNQL